MNEYWSIGLIRLVIDLWRRKATCRIVEKMLKRVSKRHGLRLLDSVLVPTENFKSSLLEMGYEITSSGIVNNVNRLNCNINGFSHYYLK